jgi:hypothetical protein
MILAMNDTVNSLIRVAIVGPCSAGKSTLSPALKEAGYETRQPAQEHSFAPNMWRRLSKPDILIYLDLSYEQARARRPHIDGGPERLEGQHRRLAHAREHCDYYLDTSDLTPQEVRETVLGFLDEWRQR